ncbi:NADP-dependent phosphogluconate dehydrogenase [Minwuia sp.]|uniref:NADP-dependent phosphogluconate dehydrogenase n=1 Tax=Minwuia sp. TaxID=2493630 RepID=UPI003A9056AB
MNPVQNHIGLVGLGVMGRNLALNLRDHGMAVTAWDPWAEARSWQADRIVVTDGIAALVSALPRPRTIMLMVKAGAPVDEAIDLLRPLLDDGDIIVDGGNSRFSDTERRQESLSVARIRFAGLGVSGGAEGARSGPAMMLGCDDAAWRSLRPILGPVAAQAEGTACLERFGPGGAGHFVKMVHNGIEYAVMQAIAEVWHALRFAGNSGHRDSANALKTAEQGYLVEITREILETADAETGVPLIDIVSDRAGHKGTGGWCLEAALDLGVPVPAIAAAMAMRQLSSMPHPRDRSPAARIGSTADLLHRAAGSAIDAATAIALAQGFSLALTAAGRYGWDISIERMARSWRAGSILRMPVLDRLTGGVSDPRADFLPPALRRMMERNLPGLREFTGAAIAAAAPAPVLGASLAWADSFQLTVLPTAMIQAQRDRFGAHGFGRTDRPGIHHGPWHDAAS